MSNEQERMLLKRQKVLADFGDFALQSENLDEVLTQACRLVAEAMGTRRAKVLEIEEGGRSLLVRAGVGWDPDIVGRTRIEMNERSSESFSIRERKPVISRDIKEEKRFDVPDFMREAGVAALANVPILLPGGHAYGLLQVDDTEQHDFDEDDTQFLRTYATILGPIVDRLFKLRELRLTEERFRMTVEEASDYAIFITDKDDRITDWLPGAAAVFGWNAKEAKGQPGSVVFTPEDRAAGQDRKEIETARREGVAPNVRWHQRKDGSRVFIEGSVRALRDGRGEVTGFIKIGQDVTQRREADEVLHENEVRQAFLLRLSDALRPLADPAEITGMASRLLGEWLNVTRVYYAEWPPGTDYGEVARDYAADGATSLAGRYPIEAFRSAYDRVSEGRTWIVEDNATAPGISDAERRYHQDVGVIAWVDVPLTKQGQPIAVLCVVQDKPREWTAAEIALCEETAERCWAAVERARAEALRRRAEEFNTLLVRFSDEVRGLIDPHAVAEAACRIVVEKVGAERAYWAEVDWATREYVVGAAVHGEGIPVIAGRFPVDAWEPFSSLHLAGQPVVVDDTQADTRLPPAVKEGYAAIAVGADLAVPVMVNGQLRSTFAVNQRLPRQWTAEEVALVSAIAGRCWSEVERARAEAAVRESEERQTFLLSFSDKLRAEPGPDAAANLAVRMLADHLQLDRCYLANYRLDDDRADIAYQVGNGRVAPMPDMIVTFNLPEGIRGCVRQNAGDRRCAVGRTFVAHW